MTKKHNKEVDSLKRPLPSSQSWLIAPKTIHRVFTIVLVGAMVSWLLLDHVDFYSPFSAVLSTAKVIVPLIFWGSTIIIGFDILATVLGYNTPFLSRFYRELLLDLRVPALSAACLFLVYATIRRKYTPDAADFAWIGFAFLATSVLNLWEVRRYMTRRPGFGSSVFRIWLILTIAGWILSFLCVWFVMQDDLVGGKALFLQLSVLFAGISTLVETQRLKYFKRTERMETSPIWLAFFSKYGSGLYEETHNMVKDYNQHRNERLKRRRRK